MTPVQSIKPVFFDNSGNVLENGQIYIGQPDTDPRTSPKTVTFEDSAGIQFTAAQPLRTIGGKIVYNGRPIVALVDGEHSMLVLTSSGAQVDYTASIATSGSGGSVDLSDTIRVGLILDDVKAFDASVGDVLRSVGRATATDNLGADWLVISSTGSPGDDVDLIDLDNGLQAQRDKSKLYTDSVLPYVADQTFNPDAPTQVWSGSSGAVNVTSLSDTGAGFYIVKVSSGRQFLIASHAALTAITADVFGSGHNEIDAGPSTFTVYSTSVQIDYSGGTKFFRVYEYQYEINNAGTVVTNRTATALAITNIYKV